MTDALTVLQIFVSLGYGLAPRPDHGLRITRPGGTTLEPALREAVDQNRAQLRAWVDPASLRNRLRLPATVPIDPKLAVILAWLGGFRDAFRKALYGELRDEYARVCAAAVDAGDDPPAWFMALEAIERVAVRHMPVTEESRPRFTVQGYRPVDSLGHQTPGTAA
jgi:hypothetical protein